jgi:hypothetical protein
MEKNCKGNERVDEKEEEWVKEEKTKMKRKRRNKKIRYE